jgi:cysteine dioxygenase
MTPLPSISPKIDEILERLLKSTVQNYGEILASVNIKAVDLDAFCSWKKEVYTRNCIYRNDDFELLLICWQDQHASPIHDHGGQACWVYVAEGTLVENRYEAHEEDKDSFTLLETIRYEQGSVSFMDDAKGYHDLANASSHRALSLHLYCKPIDDCRVYNKDKAVFEWFQTKYDTQLDGTA